MKLLLALAEPALAASRFDIRERGAKGNGQVLDTAAIQKALDDCAASGGGTVVFPPGRFVAGTIDLRSGVTLHLEAGARLIGTTNLARYAQPTPPAFMPEAKWGKWHRGLIVGENVEDVAITGLGTKLRDAGWKSVPESFPPSPDWGAEASSIQGDGQGIQAFRRLAGMRVRVGVANAPSRSGSGWIPARFPTG